LEFARVCAVVPRRWLQYQVLNYAFISLVWILWLVLALRTVEE
jgi:hypothetical protein